MKLNQTQAIKSLLKMEHFSSSLRMKSSLRLNSMRMATLNFQQGIQGINAAQIHTTRNAGNLMEIMNNNSRKNGIRCYSAGPEKLTISEIEDRVIALLKQFDKVNAEKVSLDSHFINDLGLDSLDQVEITMSLEDEFNIEITDKDAEDIFTPRQAVEKTVFAGRVEKGLAFPNYKMDFNRQKHELKARMLQQPVIEKMKYSVKAEKGSDPTIKSSELKPVLYSNRFTPINKQLYDVITALKLENRPLTNQECINKSAIDIMATPELFQAIKKNERVTYNPIDQTFQFKPRFNVETKQDLLALLENNRGSNGMDVKELKASSSGVTKLIDELDELGSVLVIRNPKDNSAKNVYYNDSSLNLIISHDFKTAWHELFIPVETELVKQLTANNLKPMAIWTPKEESKSSKKKGRKTTNRFKRTNTHLGIDLTADYVNPDNQ